MEQSVQLKCSQISEDPNIPSYNCAITGDDANPKQCQGSEDRYRLLQDICLVADDILVFHSVGSMLCDYQTTRISMDIKNYCTINYPLRSNSIELAQNNETINLNIIYNHQISNPTTNCSDLPDLLPNMEALDVTIITLQNNQSNELDFKIEGVYSNYNPFCDGPGWRATQYSSDSTNTVIYQRSEQISGSTNGNDKAPSTETIIIFVGIFVLVAIINILICYCVMKRRDKREAAQQNTQLLTDSENDIMLTEFEISETDI